VLVPDFFRTGPVSITLAGTQVLLADIRDRMAAIRVPTLLVWGDGDPLVPLRYGEAMQQQIPGSRLVVLPRAAHVPMWDAPEAFNEAALAFLDDVEAAPFAAVNECAFGWGISGWTDGIAHRQAGRNRDVVLIHGLGMSSAYFVRFARALFDRGWNPIAPDFPGFGESNDAPASDPRAHARIAARWADALGIRGAVWIGHSIGCNTVGQLARLRPDLVRAAIYIGPLWTRTAHPQLRFFPRLALDAFREPVTLFRYVIPAYWRCGMWRWARTWLRFVPDIGAGAPQGLMIAGARDPLPDDSEVGGVLRVDGAHACHFSHPDETADVIAARESPRSRSAPR
jgi:pimeloyl-ACP methyl ester carboxylesterase